MRVADDGRNPHGPRSVKGLRCRCEYNTHQQGLLCPRTREVGEAGALIVLTLYAEDSENAPDTSHEAALRLPNDRVRSASSCGGSLRVVGGRWTLSVGIGSPTVIYAERAITTRCGIIVRDHSQIETISEGGFETCGD